MTALVSLTKYTPTDDADVIDAASYAYVDTRSVAGTSHRTLATGTTWPAPERSIGSFALTYLAGWEVTDTENNVPASVRFMIDRAIKFRAGSGLGNISIGSLKIDVADSYSTDRLPGAITSIGRAWAYRPGIFSAKP